MDPADIEAVLRSLSLLNRVTPVAIQVRSNFTTLRVCGYAFHGRGRV